MQVNQEVNKSKIFCKATARQRILAGVVLLAVLCVFGLFWLIASDKIRVVRWLGVCGLKQRTGFPCPTCGMTTAAIAFVRGEILKSFYIQPAGALFCCGLVISGILAFFTAVFGVHFVFLKRFFSEIKVRYLILAFIIIIIAGWSVTFARALAARIGGG